MIFGITKLINGDPKKQMSQRHLFYRILEFNEIRWKGENPIRIVIDPNNRIKKSSVILKDKFSFIIDQ